LTAKGSSAAAGAATPLVSGTVRALWARTDPALRPTAYALDATATEFVFVAGPTTVAAITVLGIIGTGFATIIANRLIGTHGSARAMLVNYLIPGFALMYGVTVLGEPLTVAEVLGLALILTGVTLASGVVRLPRRAVAEA
jgi:drug/metabolite transporter (DMT)-like permease